MARNWGMRYIIILVLDRAECWVGPIGVTPLRTLKPSEQTWEKWSSTGEQRSKTQGRIVWIFRWSFSITCLKTADFNAASLRAFYSRTCGRSSTKKWLHKFGCRSYPLVNWQFDPENHQFLMETSLPSPLSARVYPKFLGLKSHAWKP